MRKSLGWTQPRSAQESHTHARARAHTHAHPELIQGLWSRPRPPRVLLTPPSGFGPGPALSFRSDSVHDQSRASRGPAPSALLRPRPRRVLCRHKLPMVWRDRPTAELCLRSGIGVPAPPGKPSLASQPREETRECPETLIPPPLPLKTHWPKPGSSFQRGF